MGEGTAALWRHYAGKLYDRLYELRSLVASLEQIVLVAEVEPWHRVLDIGSGTGFLLRTFAAAGLAPTVTELDGSPEMLDQAHTIDYDGEVEFIEGDLNAGLFQWHLIGKYDRIFMINVAYTLDDPPAALRKAGMVAYPHAVLIVSTPKAGADKDAIMSEHLDRVEAAGGNREIEAARLRPILREIDAINARIITNRAFHFPDEAELRSWFDETPWQVRSVAETYAGQNWLVVADRKP